MTITTNNIKLLKSERLTDFDDGGGRMTGVVVPDNEVNGLFAPISHLDRTGGDVSIRKGFFHVDTADNQTLYGAMTMIAEPPADANVSVLLFSSGSWTDERLDIQHRIENYRIKSVRSRWILYGLHPSGMKTLQMYCLKEAASPEVNDVICLVAEAVEQGSILGTEQFFKIERIISRETQTFIDDVDGVTEFQRDVIIVATTTELIYDFYGNESVTRRTSSLPDTRIRTTQVADAASYYGIRPITAALEVNDNSLDIGTPFLPLVPSSLVESALTDVLAGLGSASMVQSGPEGALSVPDASTSAGAGVTISRFFGTGLARKSLSITVPGGTLTDNGNGGITGLSDDWTGDVDYAEGSFSISKSTSWSGTLSATATPAGAVIAQSFSLDIQITDSNRYYTYVQQLTPRPAAGTLTIDYRALAKWIRLTDNGAGQLVGSQPGQGSGTVNYATGSVTLTIPTYPDVNSSILFNYGTAKTANRRDADTDIEAPYIYAVMPVSSPVSSIKPGSLTVSWYESTVLKTATDNGEGVLNGSGGATGRVVYSTGAIGFKPVNLPDNGSVVLYEWEHQNIQSLTNTPTASGSPKQVSYTLTSLPVQPNSFRAQWIASDTSDYGQVGVFRRDTQFSANDDGAGGLVGFGPDGNPYSVGTIDYATGAVVLQVENTRPAFIPSFASRRNLTTGGLCVYISDWTLGSVGFEFEPGTPITSKWIVDGATQTAAEYELEAPPAVIDLTPTVADTIVPGSVAFTFRGRTYVDRAGSLYYGVNPATNAATLAGSIDYQSGEATLTDYVAGGSNALSMKSLLTLYKEAGVNNVFGRTPGAPLRAGTFTVRANILVGGAETTGSANIDGDITGEYMIGKVDWVSGAYQIIFGEMVTASEYTSEPWYDADNVVAGEIWKPLQVLASSIYLNCVTYTSIPLDPTILGLDPVRLPDNGMILGYKKGNFAIIHHTEVESIATPTAGQVIDCGRTALAFVEVRDSVDAAILSTWYTVNKTTGTVTMSDPLNLAAYTLPLKVHHTIAQLVIIADVQVTGEITFSPRAERAFPEGSYLSGCLVAPGGNLLGRIVNPYEQETWTGVWSDSRIGDAPSAAAFNDVSYPITTTNAGAITERWALIFTNTSQFNIVGEEYGVVGTGTISANASPINGATSAPFFTINKDAFGTGWAAGNAIRFNTIGAGYPIDMVRTVLPGPSGSSDKFKLRLAGDST